MKCTTSEPLPSLSEFWSANVEAFSFYSSFLFDFGNFCGLLLGLAKEVKASDLVTVTVLAIFLTKARTKFSENLARPLGSRLGLAPRTRARLAESLWKLCFYSFMSIWLSISIYRYHRCFHLQPVASWANYSGATTRNCRLIALTEIAFYAHALYALVFLDERRSDDHVMTVHHVTALAAIAIVYLKAMEPAMPILLYYDVADIPLEVSKVLAYLKVRNGARDRKFEVLSKITFLVFLATFVVTRFVLAPFKTVYALCRAKEFLATPLPEIGLLLVLLWTLTACCLYWFFCMLKVLASFVLMGGEAEDLRERNKKIN